MRSPSKSIASSFLLLLCSNGKSTNAILQTAQLNVQLSNGVAYELLVSQASFGSYPHQGVEKNSPHVLVLAPMDNPLLCQNVTSPMNDNDNNNNKNGVYMMVPRGECTFETKAMNAQRLGAAGVIVEGSLASRYTLNKTNDDHPMTDADIIFPSNLHDYDCAKGQATIPASAISMVPLPYNAAINDNVLSGDSAANLCLANSKDSLQNCPSKACLLTGDHSETGDWQACCAWDLSVWLYNDPTFAAGDVVIPAVYVTMQQGQQLRNDLAASPQQHPVMITMSARVRANYNISALLIWALGVGVAGLAAYLSASDYRSMTRLYKQHQQEEEPLSPSSAINNHNNGNGDAGPTRPRPPPTMASPPGEETLELGAEHALGFIVMASTGLLVLFFFKIYSIVKILYGFGCSRAVMQVIFLPLFSSLFRRGRISNKVVIRTELEDIGDITTVDLLAGVCGYALGLAWLIVAFTVHHPETNTFFWVTQDVMGACMCIMFLSLIKLNSMKVASILLLVAFFYDIFFVFVTPLIFKGESVMITVATSGGPPKADPSWCEKYPSDTNCQGGDPLPMLLTMPRIHDYQGGASLLGLGDIVLPGLLLSFAARLDAAKTFLGASSSSTVGIRPPSNPYFGPLLLAYAIGLMMANVAVYIMNMGQPALLYLVPMCLGSMCFMGWRRNELAGLWEGPKLIRTVDAMIYGEYEEPLNQHEVDDINDVPGDAGSEVEAVPPTSATMQSSEVV